MKIEDVKLINFDSMENILGKRVELNGGVKSHSRSAVYFTLMQRKGIPFEGYMQTGSQSLY